MESRPTGRNFPAVSVPFPGANPRLLPTRRDSSLCLQTANPEQRLTARNNYLAGSALSTFQIPKGDKATRPAAQARRAAGAAGTPWSRGWRDERCCTCHPPTPPRCPLSGAPLTDGPVLPAMPGAATPAPAAEQQPPAKAVPIYFAHPSHLFN